MSLLSALRLSFALALVASHVLTTTVPAADETAESRPNVVLIFCDDLAYADIGPFGAKGHQTPHLDRMAAEGRKFTNFYVSQAVCGASRASLLTGCYSNRVSWLGAPGPGSKVGLSLDETLLPEIFKSQGYATGMVGKWHLGHLPPFLPTKQGFDEYFGLPYSNDMWPHHPEKLKFPALPLIEGDRIVDDDVTAEDQKTLTKRYAERAVDFIDRNHERPFFLYLAHSMPHVPLFASEQYAGTQSSGLYGDVIAEIDASVGQILASLAKHGIDDRTLIIFTSDNGPWESYGNHAGDDGGLREGKGTAFEGGVRVPCVMRWPGKIPAGTTCDSLAATIDVLPTLTGLIGAELPERKIDGLDIAELMTAEACPASPHEYYAYYYGAPLCAVRSGDWKLVFPHEYRSLVGEPGRDGKPAGYAQRKTELALFNLADDPTESRDVKAEHPNVVARLETYADDIRSELGDGLTGTKGTEIRPHMTLDEAVQRGSSKDEEATGS
ncbi:MAG TPA: sulfatase [Pirellulaceae bacterium]|jgi:arylsulfatase A-like enzyme|nr:sulfatase [Pirellulaceae bacterium]